MNNEEPSSTLFDHLSYETIVEYAFQQFKHAYSVGEVSSSTLHEISYRHPKLEDLFLPEKWIQKDFLEHGPYRCPIYFSAESGADSRGKIHYDLWLNVFLLLSGIQEICNSERDHYGRFTATQSLQYRDDFILVPAVNIHFEQLAKQLTARGIKCEKKQFDQPVVFTHDIDHVRSGWFQAFKLAQKQKTPKNLLRAAKMVFVKLFGLGDPHFSALRAMLALDLELNTKAISFLMTTKSKENADYYLEKLLRKVDFNQVSVGVHLGFNTSQSQANSEQEQIEFERLLGKPADKTRQHFLKFEITETPAIHEAIGIKEDYSLGFADAMGFRNSCCTPFNLFLFEENRGSTVLEIPQFFMDGTLITYEQNASEEARQVVYREIEQLLLNFNCSFSVLFHNTCFNEDMHPGFSKLYSEIALLSRQYYK